MSRAYGIRTIYHKVSSEPMIMMLVQKQLSFALFVSEIWTTTSQKSERHELSLDHALS